MKIRRFSRKNPLNISLNKSPPLKLNFYHLNISRLMNALSSQSECKLTSINNPNIDPHSLADELTESCNKWEVLTPFRATSSRKFFRQIWVPSDEKYAEKGRSGLSSSRIGCRFVIYITRGIFFRRADKLQGEKKVFVMG